MFLLKLIILLSFFPFPISTPIGNVIAADVVAIIALFHVLAEKAASAREAGTFSKFMLIAVCCFFAIFATNIIHYGGTVTVSPIFKYGMYLLAFPAFIQRVVGRYIELHGLEKFNRNFVNWMCVCSGAFCSVLFALWAAGVTAQDEQGNYYIFTYHKNASGILLYFCAVFGILGWRIHKLRKSFAVLLGSIALLILTGSRSNLFAAMVVGAWLLLVANGKAAGVRFSASKICLGFIIVGIISLIVNYSGIFRLDELLVSPDEEINSANSRFVLWGLAIEYFLSSPVLGVGYGGFAPEMGGFFEDIAEPHNGLLQILSQGGLVGVLLFSATIFLLFKNQRDVIAFNKTFSSVKAICLGYLFSCMFGILWVRGDGHLFWIMFWTYISVSRCAGKGVAHLNIRAV